MNVEKIQAFINELSIHWNEASTQDVDLRNAYIDAIDYLSDLILEINRKYEH